MNINVKPNGTGWQVRIEAPEHGRSVDAGQLLQLSDDHWCLNGPSMTYEFKAASLDAARQHLSEILHAQQSDSLSAKTMSTYIEVQLRTSNALACRTGSLTGWVSGIGLALGRFLAEDLPEGQDATFWSQLRDLAEQTRDFIKERKSLHGDLETILSELQKSMHPDDEQPPHTAH